MSVPRTGHTERDLTIRLKDHLAHRWTDELLTYRLSFETGTIRPGRLNLFDEKGNSIPIQVTEAKLNKDGSLASASVSFVLSELPVNGERTFRLTSGSKTPAYKTDLSVKEKGGILELTTSKAGVRLLAGARRFDPPLPAESAPAPIQAIRLRSGAWVGRTWWEAENRCVGYESELVASGPVFADARVRVLFEGGKRYTATYRLIAGQEAVLMEEEFNLGDPQRFVIPAFGERERLMWEMWTGKQGRSESPNSLHFSFYDPKDFTPDTGRWGGASATVPAKGSKPVNGHYEYALDYTNDRFDIAINAHVDWGGDESAYYTAWDKRNPLDAVSVVGVRASRWIHPDLRPHLPGHHHIEQHTGTNDAGIWVTKTPEIYLRAPVNMGRRAYLLAALDAKTDLAKDLGTFDRTGELLVKYGSKPLDKIKDWALEWEDKLSYPHLTATPGGMGGEKDPAKAKKQFEEVVGAPLWFGPRAWRDATLQGYGPNLGNTGHMFLGLFMHWNAKKLDSILASPALTPEQRREARALTAYMEYCAWDQDHFPGREQGYGWGTPNQGTIAFTGRALFAKLLQDHPKAPEWMEQGSRFSVWDIERYVNPEGVPMECPGYTGAGMEPNLKTLYLYKDKLDISSLLPRLRKLVDLRAKTLPPPDPRFGQRTLLTIGDTPYQMDGVSGMLALVLHGNDPDKAAEALWSYRETGGSLRNDLIASDMEPDEKTAAKKPDLSSKSFPGFGAVLRTGTGTPDETFLFHYHGDYSIWHYHADQGELVFYAKGAPLMMDFGSQYQPYIRQGCFHNTITFNHQETDALRPCPGRGHKDCFYSKASVWYEHDKEPYTCLQNPVLSTGEIKEFAALPDADYACGQEEIGLLEETPYRYDNIQCYPTPEISMINAKPFVWSRQTVLVKDKDPSGPNYFVVHDDLTGNEKLEPAFNLWSLTKEVQIQGNRAFLPGQWGVDLDVFIAEPPAPRTVARELAHQNASANAGRFQVLHKRPFEERQKLLRVFGQPGGGGFCVLVYPRKPDEPKPEFAALPGIPGVKVTLPDQTHWVIASRKEVTLQEKAFTFSGTVAVIKQLGDGRWGVSLLSGGRFESAKHVLHSPGPACLTISK
jgi:hypothetical protein